eukprot:CAMPEP_0194125434 /NCGR_PEP_ID=MMETSP0150-20130528/59462_1 /TAXON_ID=122233 /ORGANISM="Chaetoceros debilis, Strain MM31A-1" /LENGTH=1273 /DNA_ID=CAMNT_0038819245 /DNA_START=246 /DNA_END=4067 /DNA_ORIENTATION=-
MESSASTSTTDTAVDLNKSKADAYIEKVRSTFTRDDDIHIYDEFVDAISTIRTSTAASDSNSNSNTTIATGTTLILNFEEFLSTVSNLFQDHEQFIFELNEFLPEGYKIRIQGNESDEETEIARHATCIYYTSPENTDYKLFRQLHRRGSGHSADDHDADDHSADDHNPDDHSADDHSADDHSDDHNPDNASSNTGCNLLVQPPLKKTNFAMNVNAVDHKVIESNTLTLDRNEIVLSSTIIQGVDVEVCGEGLNVLDSKDNVVDQQGESISRSRNEDSGAIAIQASRFDESNDLLLSYKSQQQNSAPRMSGDGEDVDDKALFKDGLIDDKVLPEDDFGSLSGRGNQISSEKLPFDPDTSSLGGKESTNSVQNGPLAVRSMTKDEKENEKITNQKEIKKEGQDVYVCHRNKHSYSLSKDRPVSENEHLHHEVKNAMNHVKIRAASPKETLSKIAIEEESVKRKKESKRPIGEVIEERYDVVNSGKDLNSPHPQMACDIKALDSYAPNKPILLLAEEMSEMKPTAPKKRKIHSQTDSSPRGTTDFCGNFETNQLGDEARPTMHGLKSSVKDNKSAEVNGSNVGRRICKTKTLEVDTKKRMIAVDSISGTEIGIAKEHNFENTSPLRTKVGYQNDHVLCAPARHQQSIRLLDESIKTHSSQLPVRPIFESLAQEDSNSKTIVIEESNTPNDCSLTIGITIKDSGREKQLLSTTSQIDGDKKLGEKSPEKEQDQQTVVKKELEVAKDLTVIEDLEMTKDKYSKLEEIHQELSDRHLRMEWSFAERKREWEQQFKSQEKKESRRKELLNKTLTKLADMELIHVRSEGNSEMNKRKWEQRFKAQNRQMSLLRQQAKEGLLMEAEEKSWQHKSNEKSLAVIEEAKEAMETQRKALGTERALMKATEAGLRKEIVAHGNYRSLDEETKEAMETQRKAFGTERALMKATEASLRKEIEAFRKYRSIAECAEQAMETQRKAFETERDLMKATEASLRKELKACGNYRSIAESAKEAMGTQRKAFETERALHQTENDTRKEIEAGLRNKPDEKYRSIAVEAKVPMETQQIVFETERALHQTENDTRKEMEAGPRKELGLNEKYRSVTKGAKEVATQRKPLETERAWHQTNVNTRKEIKDSLRKELKSFQMMMQSTTGESSYLGKSEESRVGMIHDSIDSLQQSYSPKEKYSKKQGSCSASNCAAKQYFRGSNSISPLRNESDLNLSDPTSLSKIDSAPYEDTTPPLALPHPEEPSDEKKSTKREKLSRNCRKRPRSDDYPFLYG